MNDILGRKLAPRTKIILQFLILLIALPFWFRFFLAPGFNCSQLPTDIVSTSNWEIVDSTLPANVLWERTLTPNDLLLAASADGAIFHRSYDSSGCSKGQVVALDASSGNVKWHFSADLVRNITSFPGGYLLAKCCASAILLDTTGAKVWESETLPARTSNVKFVFANDKAYFVVGSDTYKLELADGSLSRMTQGSQEQEAFWLRQLISPVGTSNYRVYHAADVMITTPLPGHLFAYQIPTGEALWDANLSFQAEPVFDGNHLITYDSQKVIQFHDIHSGREIGRIALQSNTQPNNSTTGVILAAATGKIFIRDFQTSELIALNVDLPE